MPMKQSIPCVLMRGGTSKGVFIREEELPADAAARSKLLLRLMGSPDIRQIDGLGGATSVTSKVAIVKRSDRTDADVDYTFAQVGIDKALVDTRGNCGNISSAVGPYAIEAGIVTAQSPTTTVRIYNTNTKKMITEEVFTPNGVLTYKGDYHIDGVPGTAAPVKLTFEYPAGAVFGQLLPTGNPLDCLKLPNGDKVQVSIVDAANPLVFVKAEDMGLTGKELPGDLEHMPGILEQLEMVRGLAAQLLGLTKDYRDASWETPAIPKMTFVAPPDDYTASTKEKIEAGSIDLLSRMMSMQKPHQTYAMTGAMCTACAAVIPNTVVQQVLGKNFDPSRIRIGHPGGLIEAGVAFTCDETTQAVTIASVSGFRTARLLLNGQANLD